MKKFELVIFALKVFFKKLLKFNFVKIFLKIIRILYKNKFRKFSLFLLKIIDKIFINNFFIQLEFAQFYKKKNDFKNLMYLYDKIQKIFKGNKKNEILFMALSDSFNLLKNEKYYLKYYKLLYPKIINKNINFFPLVIKFSVKDSLEISKYIYEYKKKYPINSYSYHGHHNIYQSDHDLHKKNKFKHYSEYLKKFYIEKILSKILKKKIRIIFKKMWFVITREEGHMKSHNHPEGSFSGVFYYQVPKVNASGYLKIFNPMKNIIFLEIKNGEILKRKITKKSLSLKPKQNDVYIFNSFLMHSVTNSEDIDLDRISIPFDFILK